MNLTRSLVNLSCMVLIFSIALAEEPGIYRLPAEAKDILVQMKSTVRHGSFGGDLIADLSADEVENLVHRGFQVEQLYASVFEQDAYFRSLTGFDDFHTYEEIRDDFYSYAASHPDIAVIEVLGYSVQNRELFAMKITDNPNLEEDEPELVFWGGIHGDEYTSAELPYLYMLYLCENYGIDPSVTQYVDNNEIWCIPMINPDGHEMGIRYNANWVDLNRDYGYQWDGWGSSSAPFSQIETRIVRQFCMENNITLSTTFHCSGDVLFYQWGYSPDATPDADVIYRVGDRYASLADYDFENSWEDYETHGELLDYLYGSHCGLCYTVETSSFSGSVPQTFARNQLGMNFFCRIAGEGLHGIVTDAQTGEPLWAAVWITGRAIPSYTDPELGDLHRLMLPGIYDLTVWANGYQPQSVNDVTVSFGSPCQFEVALQPGGGEYAFMVTSVNQEDPNNSYNNVTQPAWALGAPDGFPCSIGSNGFIVLDFGPGHEIMDGPGDDFTVTEAIFPRDPEPEGYRVYSGDAYTQNALIGTAIGTASFDLGPAGITSTRYLKIVDASGSNPDLRFAGMDLDGITVINSRAVSAVGKLAVASLPAKLELSVYPNPFNPTTIISFQLPEAGLVKLEIFDINGRNVGARLPRPYTVGFGESDLRWYPAGTHQITFDGSGLPSGIYIYRLQAGDLTASGKMILMK